MTQQSRLFQVAGATPSVEVSPDWPPSKQLTEWISGALVHHQGQAFGLPFELLPWQGQFLRSAWAAGRTTSALSVARGAGKTSFLAAVIAGHIVGPLAAPSSEVVVVCPSMRQATITFRAVRALVRPWSDAEPGWSIQNTVASARMRRGENDVEFVAMPGSNPDRLEGLQAGLVLVDEAAALAPNVAEPVRAVLQTSGGKIPGFRMVAISTWAAVAGSWFTSWADGGADYAQVHRADPDGDPFDSAQWRKACPSLKDRRRFRHLNDAYRADAERARTDAYEMAAFRSKRLNLGGAATVVNSPVEAAEWEEATGFAGREGGYVLGVDLGAATSMTGLAAYWPRTGRLEVVGFFGAGDLAERERRAGLAGERLYRLAFERGELLVTGARVPDLAEVLEVARDRFGTPDAVIGDTYRRAELQDALDRADGYHASRSPFVERKMNYLDGAEDLRQFRTGVVSGQVLEPPPRSLLLAAALRSARTITDTAGNEKLSRGTEGGRRHGTQDDVLAAALLAVSLGRRKGKRVQKPRRRSAPAA